MICQAIKSAGFDLLHLFVDQSDPYHVAKPHRSAEHRSAQEASHTIIDGTYLSTCFEMLPDILSLKNM